MNNTAVTTNGLRLALMFSEGVGLETWHNTGNLAREAALYKKLARYLKEVKFITYGGRKDHAFREAVLPVSVCASSYLRRPHMLRRAFAPVNRALLFLNCGSCLKKADIIKTNQISGAENAVLAKKLYGKKLLVRCGYLPSRLNDIAERYSLPKQEGLAAAEKFVFNNADMIMVPTDSDKKWLCDKYGIKEKKIRVVPNYVETDRFAPLANIEKRYDLVMVGRNSPEKNIGNLLKALHLLKDKGLGVSILFIGESSGSKEVLNEMKIGGLSITDAGRVDSKDMPRRLQEARAYIVTSFYEGNSKSLLEAMSCGMPCIGTDTDSINKIISHKKTGYLCGMGPREIAEATESVLNNKAIQEELGANARRFVSENFSLDKILKAELDILKEMADGR